VRLNNTNNAIVMGKETMNGKTMLTGYFQRLSRVPVKLINCMGTRKMAE
jgi:hypothetical protein